MDQNSWLFVFAALQGLGALATFFRVDVRIMRGLKMSQSPIMYSATKREKVMGILALGALALSSVGFYRSLVTGSPATILSVQHPMRGRPTVGSPIGVNVFVSHLGPEPLAQDVRWDAIVQLLPKLTPSQELEIFKEFKKTSRPSGPEDMGLGKGSFRSYDTRVLSKEDMRDVKQGRLRVYLMGYATYKDTKGSHDQVFCSVFQPPRDGDVLLSIWQTCAGIFNSIR